MSAEALSVSGWREDSAQGDSFTIQIGGGVEDGTIEFETEGCTVCQAQGGSNTTFVVTVDAGEGDAYTLLVKYGSKGGSARTSTQRSGSVQRVGDHRQPNSQETAADPDPFEGAYGAEVWLLGGIILSIAALLVLILLLKRSRNGN